MSISFSAFQQEKTGEEDNIVIKTTLGSIQEVSVRIREESEGIYQSLIMHESQVLITEYEQITNNAGIIEELCGQISDKSSAPDNSTKEHFDDLVQSYKRMI